MSRALEQDRTQINSLGRAGKVIGMGKQLKEQVPPPGVSPVPPPENFTPRYNPAIAEKLATYTRNSPFAALLGMEIVSYGPGTVCCQLPVTEKLLSAIGAIHGGAIVSLIDHVLSMAVYPLVESGKWVATLEFKVSYLAPVTQGTLVARAEVVALKNRLGTVRVDLFNGNTLVATAVGTTYVRDKLASTPK